MGPAIRFRCRREVHDHLRQREISLGCPQHVIRVARRDSDRDLRSKAVFWLGQSRDPRVLKFLEELINR